MVRRYCQKHNIPASSFQIMDMASEAIRRRLVEKVKLLDDRVVILNDRLTTVEGQLTQLHGMHVALQAQADLTDSRLVALNAKVDGYHP